MKIEPLLRYSKQIFDDKNLKDQRKIGTNFNISVINDLIDLHKFDFDEVSKTQTIGDYMGWHLDNASIIKHKKLVEPNKYLTQIKISERCKLHFHKKKPDYSLIVYDSDYGIDFNGGILEFIDGTKIYPKKNMYVFFNSEELHQVSRITKGVKNFRLYKFYHK